MTDGAAAKIPSQPPAAPKPTIATPRAKPARETAASATTGTSDSATGKATSPTTLTPVPDVNNLPGAPAHVDAGIATAPVPPQPEGTNRTLFPDRIMSQPSPNFMRVIVCANDALENAKKNTKRMNRIMVYPDSPEQKQKRPRRPGWP